MEELPVLPLQGLSPFAVNTPPATTNLFSVTVILSLLHRVIHYTKLLLFSLSEMPLGVIQVAECVSRVSS